MAFFSFISVSFIPALGRDLLPDCLLAGLPRAAERTGLQVLARDVESSGAMDGFNFRVSVEEPFFAKKNP